MSCYSKYVTHSFTILITAVLWTQEGISIYLFSLGSIFFAMLMFVFKPLPIPIRASILSHQIAEQITMETKYSNIFLKRNSRTFLNKYIYINIFLKRNSRTFLNKYGLPVCLRYCILIDCDSVELIHMYSKTFGYLDISKELYLRCHC